LVANGSHQTLKRRFNLLNVLVTVAGLNKKIKTFLSVLLYVKIFDRLYFNS